MRFIVIDKCVIKWAGVLCCGEMEITGHKYACSGMFTAREKGWAEHFQTSC